MRRAECVADCAKDRERVAATSDDDSSTYQYFGVVVFLVELGGGPGLLLWSCGPRRWLI